MSSSWPVADFDQVRRLRVMAAGIFGAELAEKIIPTPFDLAWRILSDIENELGTLMAATGGFRIPGHAALLPIAVRRANQHVLQRIAARLEETT
ncbi:MAG: hypothetical protein JWN52_2265 [Actinomycetia bacterium]|nr:hypothetical protein [Actinomycetes bacterium]